MSTVTLFLSTARSGTQWLAKHLGETYSDLAEVTHEPIKYAYQPKYFFRAYNEIDRMRSVPAVAAHLRCIQAVLEKKQYIELGFPCFAAIPIFYELFKSQLRLVHLVRHPVYTAASLVTHRWYQRARPDKLPEHVLLDPHDPDIIQKYYVKYWSRLSPYEKCLFYWNEMQLYALEVHARYHDVPFLRIRFEDLFTTHNAALRTLTAFLKLPWRADLVKHIDNVVDEFQRKTTAIIKWQEVFAHPQTLALALMFEYDFDDIDATSISQRYQRCSSRLGSTIWGMKRTLKTRVPFLDGLKAKLVSRYHKIW